MDDADGQPLIFLDGLKRRLLRWSPRPTLGPCHVYAMRLHQGAGAEGSLVRLSPKDGDFAQPAMHPSGRQVTFWGRHADAPGRQIWIADIEHHTCRPITWGPHIHGHPAWWPDGGSLVGFRRTGQADWRPEAQFDPERPPSQLVRLHLDGSAPEMLSDGPFIDERPAVTPDGRAVIFVSNRSKAGLNLWALDLKNGDLRQLTAGSTLDYRPVVARDGRKIAYFTRTARGADALALISWPAAEPLALPLEQSFAWVHGPWWSADSRRLLAHGLTEGERRPALWLIDSVDGVCTRLVLPGIRDSSHGSFDDAETWLAFDSRQSLDAPAPAMAKVLP